MGLPLPGVEAQLRMAHESRKGAMRSKSGYENARHAAVLILLFPEELSIKTVLIQRPKYDGVHSGQIAFPGGKQDAGETIEQTVLREVEEEIGINPNSIEILGRLTELYIPPSNSLVFPFIGMLNHRPEVFAQSAEVDEVIEVDIEKLSDKSLISYRQVELRNGIVIDTPCLLLNEKVIWGATAMIISEFNEIVNSL